VQYVFTLDSKKKSCFLWSFVFKNYILRLSFISQIKVISDNFKGSMTPNISIVNLLYYIFHQFCLYKINSCISLEIRLVPFLSNAFSWIRYIYLLTPNICLATLNIPFLRGIIPNDCLPPILLIGQWPILDLTIRSSWSVSPFH